ncbi:SpoIIE family protein phosphatase [Thermodesulfobacteriota bacterium]
MKKFIFLILAALPLVFLLSFPARADETVIVGIYQNEPLVFKDAKGNVKGIYIDVLEHIGKLELWKVEYLEGSWPECLERLDNGKIDLLVAIAYSEEREKRYDFTEQTIITNWAQIYIQKDAHIQSMLDLTGKKMAVVEGDIYYEVLREVGETLNLNPVYVEVGSYSDILDLLDKREVMTGIIPRIFGKYHEKDHRIKRTSINFSPAELRFAALAGKNKNIIDTIDRHLINLKHDKNSIFYRSRNLWIEGVHKLTFPKWLRPLWVLGFIVILVSFLSIGVLILRWQVRVRTDALKETIAEKERIESELRIAHEIQMSLLPRIFPPFPHRNEIDLYAAIEPAKEVGGDFYDYFFIDNDHLLIVIGDVSDKGVPAALFMARTKTLIKSAAKGLKFPDKILDAVNKEICIDNDSFMFITTFCGILNLKTGELNYTNAGHNPPLVVPKGNHAKFIAGTGSTALGIDDESIFTKASIVLEPGDTLFMYTDGVTEAFNQQEEVFSEERLQTELSNHQSDDVKDMVSSILQKIGEFAGEMPQTDDIAILVLNYSLKNKTKAE